MKKNEYFGIIKESWKTLFQNYKIIWIGVIAEVVFFFLVGFFSFPVMEGVLGNLRQLGNEVAAESSRMSSSLISILWESPNARYILTALALLCVIIYVIYSLLQGMIWRFCLNLTGKQERYAPYIKKFFLVNLFWYPFFVVYWIFDLFLTYTDMLGERFYPESHFFWNKLSIIFLLAIAYFAFISYVLIRKQKVWKSVKESFRIGLSNGIWILSTFVIVLSLFLVANYFMIALGGALGGLENNVSYLTYVFVGIVIVMPLMIWARIFLKEVVEAV